MLPHNFQTSRSMLNSLMSKLERTMPVFKKNSRVSTNRLPVEFVEEVDEDNVGVLREVHYTHYQVVVRQEKKTTKVRVVYTRQFLIQDRQAPIVDPLPPLGSGPNLLEHF